MAVQFTTARQPNQICAQVLTPFEAIVPPDVAGLPAGAYDMRINDLVKPFILQADNGPMPEPSEETATYRDDSAGFTFEYPAVWTVDGAPQTGSRDYVMQMTSWSHAPGDIAEETPVGGARMDVVVLDWDPKRDLNAHIEMRKQAWAASGMVITSEEARSLGGDHPAMRFIVTAPDGVGQGYFLITTVGERYLVLSGSGDLNALEAIAQTLQIQVQ